MRDGQPNPTVHVGTGRVHPNQIGGIPVPAPQPIHRGTKMARPLSASAVACLRAVEAGRVAHVHPFAWALPTFLLDVRGARRTLETLANRGFIKVDAKSPEYQRPVMLTPAGVAALAAIPPIQMETRNSATSASTSRATGVTRHSDV